MIDRPELTDPILASFYAVYNDLGHGFSESVYTGAMVIDLSAAGHVAQRECPIIVRYRGHVVGDFRADLVVDSAVIVEIKCARAIDAAHEAQLLNYLRGTTMEIGLILNFGVRPTFRRLVFDNGRKHAPNRRPISVP